MYLIYILRTSGNTLYTGITNNLEKRLHEHRNDPKKGSKYLRAFDSFELAYTEKAVSRSAALIREYQIKQLTKPQKEALISHPS